MSVAFRPFGAVPQLLPAIDLRGGRVVRLVQGAGDAEIDYDTPPVEAARRWAAEGAECLHIIDLGAAFGEPDSTAAVLEIAAELALPIQTGGGLRDEARVAALLDGGVSRVILGTRALRDPAFLRCVIERYGAERVVLAMDVADGRVKVSGWTEDSSMDVAAGIDFAVDCGARHLLVTAIDRDGTLSGPNLPLLEQTLGLAETRGLVAVAAGGIGELAHIRSVLELASAALEGVVVGRALYEGTVTVGEAVALAKTFR